RPRTTNLPKGIGRTLPHNPRNETPRSQEAARTSNRKEGSSSIPTLPQRSPTSSKSHRTLLRGKISPKGSWTTPPALGRARGERRVPHSRHGAAPDNPRRRPAGQRDPEN